MRFGAIGPCKLVVDKAVLERMCCFEGLPRRPKVIQHAVRVRARDAHGGDVGPRRHPQHERGDGLVERLRVEVLYHPDHDPSLDFSLHVQALAQRRLR